MKVDFPDMHIVINGGITSLDQAQGFLEGGLDGVMIGRTAYQSPWAILGRADSTIFGVADPFERPSEVVEAMLPYIETQLTEGHRLNSITRHMLGLFAGQPGARAWRRVLSEETHKPGADCDVLRHALDVFQVEFQ
jgi:tRNA-dihydrouridine synthase A